MPSGYLSGAIDYMAEINNDIHVVSTNYFVNRCPLICRAPRVPVGSTVFTMISRHQGDHVIGVRTIGVPQFCETWVKPVQTWRGVLPRDGRPNGPFEPARMDAIESLADEMESSCYYGEGQDPAVSGRPRQKGLRSILATNRTVAPVNAAAYKVTDFIRDTLDRCRVTGGDPDVLLVSSNFMDGIKVWGHSLTRVNAGSNIFGTPIDIFEAPFLGGVSIIEAPLLKPFTAVCLTSSEVRLRMKRNEFWNPRGARHDPHEGEWIAEGAIEVENEQHHAWLEGIKAFSAV